MKGSAIQLDYLAYKMVLFFKSYGAHTNNKKATMSTEIWNDANSNWSSHIKTKELVSVIFYSNLKIMILTHCQWFIEWFSNY